MKDTTIIQLNHQSDLKFKKCIIKDSYLNEKTGDVVVTHRVVIKLENSSIGQSRIHPYTEFISQWINCSSKYQSNIASDIVKFLNYIYFELDNDIIGSISELTVEIGVVFLNNISRTLCRETVGMYEMNLTQFYLFLCKKGILTNVSLNDFKYTTCKNRVTLNSLFEGKFKKPSHQKTTNLHNIEPELIAALIETALKYEPSIALGIYFQVFGGLRPSEVISIEYSDISVHGRKGRSGMQLNITKKDLRPDILSANISQAKKPRRQQVFAINNTLEVLFERHEKLFRVSNTNAVFIDNRKNPMTYNTYLNRFKRVKKMFIQELSKSSDLSIRSYAITLNSFKWGPHIGRGIFSNLGVSVANNATELAVMRGDSNLSSSLAYTTDIREMDSKMLELMNKLSFEVNF